MQLSKCRDGHFHVQDWTFFKLYFHYCSSSVHYCEDHIHIQVFIRDSNIWLSYIHSRFVKVKGYRSKRQPFNSLRFPIYVFNLDINILICCPFWTSIHLTIAAKETLWFILPETFHTGPGSKGSSGRVCLAAIASIREFFGLLVRTCGILQRWWFL